MSRDLYNYVDGKRLGYSVMVNGEKVESELRDGYFVVERKWAKGDKVQVHFDMEPRLVKAHAKVEQDRGRVAVERGPLVYCAEWADNSCNVLNILLNRNPKFELGKKQIAQTDVQTLTTSAQTLLFDKTGRLVVQDESLVLIPYYAWAHRGNGNMAVWLPYELSATTPQLSPSLASESKIGSSRRIGALGSLNDRLTPQGAEDRSVPYCHWWPEKNSTEWLTYTFKQEATISSSTVYWFEDQPWGGCTVPKAWRIYYQNDKGEWVEVAEAKGYTMDKGVANTVRFKPVKTKAVKLEVDQPENFSCGVYEWSVE